jgi:hypothetical protein
VGLGKLYNFYDGKFIVNVSYQLQDKSEASWWGEFVPTEYNGQLGDGVGYLIELEDGRRGRCSLKKQVNRVVNSVPALYHYHFKGLGLLK